MACWGPHAIGVRHLAGLVRHLPGDSALTGELGGWGTDLELAALTVELVHGLIGVTMAAAGAKPQWEPLKVPRPSDRFEPPPPPMSRQGIRDMLGALRDGQGG